MAQDYQLLNTARDCFQFATNFFEVIDASATHIYHSALELSPLSSIVRKFYYHQQPCPSPTVVVGIPDSWDPSTAVSTKHSSYLSSTWSPCSQFIAAVTEEAVEIRDGLTLKLLSTLQATKVMARFRHGLAYSPDGRSLACCSDTAITIWDAQTGGVVKEIMCEVVHGGLTLVWSLDGKMIGVLSWRAFETYPVSTYDVASGTTLSSSILQSRDGPFLWAHDRTFRVMTTTGDFEDRTVNILEVGSTITEVESFPFQFHSSLRTFSPTTYRVSVSVVGGHIHDSELLILDICNSEVLLQEVGSYWCLSFSPCGRLFAAFGGAHLHIWRYTSNRYARWKEFQQAEMPLGFSPTLSSILGCTHTLLYVLHLDGSPAAYDKKAATIAHGQPQDAFSPDGTYIATTYCQKGTIMITNLHSQNPSPFQFIDTNLEISAIVLTGNVLLVKGSDMIRAWLLTEEGIVDGAFGNTRANHTNRLWDISSQDSNPGLPELLQQLPSGGPGYDSYLEFSVRDEIAVVRHFGCVIRIYHTGTGGILGPADALQDLERTWYRFHNPLRDECDLYHHNSRKQNGPPKCDWPVSQTTLQEGWVKDPEGKHRLWLHARWRSSGSDVDWFDKVTALRLRTPTELLVVKF